MRSDLIDLLADKLVSRKTQPIAVKVVKPRKVTDPKISYMERHRKQWHNPEYDFGELQIIQHVDSYVARSIIKKMNRFLLAGYEFVGNNPKYVNYIKGRITEIEIATARPFLLQLTETAYDLIRFKNCMWVKNRDKRYSSGGYREGNTGRELEPVAGYFILPLETLEFKEKANSSLAKIRQTMPDGSQKEFFPEDIVHFYMNKNPGFCVGTPDLIPVIDDLELLRRIEENIEELIESNLYPLFHYQIGTDEFPQRVGPDGKTESQIARETVEYMPAGGIFFSDHRTKISAIGSEGRALRVEAYLTYFRDRVFSGLGMSGIDFGLGETANRSTADSMSKSALQEVEALQQFIKMFIEKEIIQELLLEGNFGAEAFYPENKVEIRFGVIDKEDRSRLENQTIQLFLNNLVTMSEARKDLGMPPMAEEDIEETYFKLFEEPLALIKAAGLGAAAGEALAESQTSGITQKGLKKEESTKKLEANTKKTGRPLNSPSASKKSTSSNKTSPANQHGSRSSQKYSHDFGERDLYQMFLLNGPIEETAKLNDIVRAFKQECASFTDTVNNRIKLLGEVSLAVVRSNLDWRWQEVCDRYYKKSYNAGILSSVEDFSELKVDKLLCNKDICIEKLADYISNADNVYKANDIPPYN